MYCTKCGYQINANANFCPNCGHSQKGNVKQKSKRPIFFVVGAIVVILAILLFTGKQDKDSVDSSTVIDTVETQPVKEIDPEEGEICVSCNGSGKCIACEGNGECFYCGGTELQDCFSCWKTEICNDCRYYDNICEECHGTGNCTNCKDGKEKCEKCFDGGLCVYCMSNGNGVCNTCQGTGRYNPEENKTVYTKLECVDCEDGILRCGMCEGKDCYACDGTGKGLCLFGPCDECENGYYGICDSCGGNGVCRWCLGAYIIDCSYCQDGILIETRET